MELEHISLFSAPEHVSRQRQVNMHACKGWMYGSRVKRACTQGKRRARRRPWGIAVCSIWLYAQNFIEVYYLSYNSIPRLHSTTSYVSVCCNGFLCSLHFLLVFWRPVLSIRHLRLPQNSLCRGNDFRPDAPFTHSRNPWWLYNEVQRAEYRLGVWADLDLNLCTRSLQTHWEQWEHTQDHVYIGAMAWLALGSKDHRFGGVYSVTEPVPGISAEAAAAP